MKIKLSDLWQWGGTIDRGPYVLIGVICFAIKHNLDRFVATFVFHRTWGIFNYILPLDQLAGITSLSNEQAVFLVTMVVMALPFVWIGVGLTLRRLRTVHLPTWLALLFFLPFVNLLLFALLSVLPSRYEEPVAGARGPIKRMLDAIIPDSATGSAALGVLLSIIPGVLATLLGARIFTNYGWGMFVGLPFAIGFTSSLLFGYHRPRTISACISVSAIAIGIYGVVLLLMAFEGIICLLMAAPIGLILAMMGAWFGYIIQWVPSNRIKTPSMIGILFVAVPFLMGVEHVDRSEAPLFEVRSHVDIAAPPAKVWQHVVTFAELPPPQEWLFRCGIAYPIRAEIEGRGIGALRHCVFSTGAFEEPIEVWDEPRLLRFSVTSNPAPMQEWTPYREIHPPHLEGFLVSRGGQFLLSPLADGGTRLEGTTWYYHHMWPASYWRVWADTIIHKIHLRVLRHIKNETERER